MSMNAAMSCSTRSGCNRRIVLKTSRRLLASLARQNGCIWLLCETSLCSVIVGESKISSKASIARSGAFQWNMLMKSKE